ncbi:hypothetical protein B296_00037625 [Ensete ventricosum]|uniref:Uncharacterized protein n=1 Tax=Ensete ventricosum TaxID=4639 RepID=A0A426ZZ12_ENSVE|nr:hypothetical protein B296_00037625 [Ensete ventricosum]
MKPIMSVMFLLFLVLLAANRTTGSVKERTSIRKNDIGSQDDLHKAPPVSRQPQTHPDVVDIAGMDYSPANKKPPIHN